MPGTKIDPSKPKLGLRRDQFDYVQMILLAAVVGMLALSQALDSLVQLLGVGAGPALEWMNRTLAAASALAPVP